MIDNGIKDVDELGNIQRLVIAVDSEDLSYEARQTEILDHVAGQTCSAEIYIVVQHFCFECWALGNRCVCRPKPQDPLLCKYKRHYNVAVKDPEFLTPYPGEGVNRAHFAAKYLRLLLEDKFKKLTYSKRNPTALLNPKYFGEVKRRFEETGHIRSFGNFLKAFS